MAEVQNETQSSTALARTEADTALQDPSIQAMRRAGGIAVAEKKTLSDMYKMLEGCEWGAGNSVVRGSGFSPAARGALARFAVVTRANPQIHIDMLGGKPYLNSRYYRDMTSANPHFIEDVQINVSESASEFLRQQARQAIAEAKEFGLAEPTAEVERLLEEARTLDRLRAEYNVPEWATVAIETRIRRYVENAPLDSIRRGEVQDPEKFVRTVRECNWAGNRPKAKGRNGEYDADPVGNAEPEKTARSRSFRRCAANAFSAWFDQFDKEIDRAYEYVEAEWEDVTPGREVSNGSMSTGRGEPAAGRALPQPLPTQDLTTIADQKDEREPAARPRQQSAPPRGESRSEPQPAPRTAEGSGEPSDDEEDDSWRNAARGAFFGTLTDAGIKGDEARYAWMAENGFPGSTSEWTRDDYRRAKELLLGPAWANLVDLCGQLGFETVDEYVRTNGRELPLTLRQINDETARVMADLEAT